MFPRNYRAAHLVRLAALATLTLAAWPLAVPACDICGCYAPPTNPHASSPPGFFFGVAEQYTTFDTLQLDGHEVADPLGQHLASSYAQAILGYRFDARVSLQANVPYIDRRFRRPEHGVLERGSESGLGDVSILATFTPFEREGDRSWASLSILGGVKLPTGSTHRLKEETEEEHEHEEEDEPESGVHGHDLTLGTGSYDVLLGLSGLVRRGHFLFDGDVRYTARSRGDFGYRFADDLTFGFGPGADFEGSHSQWSVQLYVSGEHKGRDTFRGVLADDTGITSWFVGPRFKGFVRHRVAWDAGVQVPVSVDNTALQLVPDLRLRAGFTITF